MNTQNKPLVWTVVGALSTLGWYFAELGGHLFWPMFWLSVVMALVALHQRQADRQLVGVIIGHVVGWRIVGVGKVLSGSASLIEPGYGNQTFIVGTAASLALCISLVIVGALIEDLARGCSAKPTCSGLHT